MVDLQGLDSAVAAAPPEQTTVSGRAPRPEAGLTASEARERLGRGLGNDMPAQTTRSYWQILRENVFTFINVSMFVLGVALVVLGRPGDVVVAIGVVLINVMVSVLQEVRAKRKLDRIALLTRPTATVVRDGREQTLDPSLVVLGDTLVVRAGDQVVADGTIIAGRADMDESLLTGESDVVPKRAGDTVYSGSFCVNGGLTFSAERVGSQSMASQITASARAFRRVATPLQFYVALIVRVLLLVAVFIEMLLFGVSLIYNLPTVTSVQNSVVVIGLVPQGLFLSIAVAYALGAVRIAGQSVIVQQANAIESLSNVDVLCLDKTGTLTANHIRLRRVQPLGLAEAELLRRLGDFAASVSTSNATSRALAEACAGAPRRVIAEVPFASERKWSGLTLAAGDRQETYVLGAPEILRPYVVEDGARYGERTAAAHQAGVHAAEAPVAARRGPAGGAAAGRIREWGEGPETDGAEGETWDQLAQAWAERGLRVVLFAAAEAGDGGVLHGQDGEPRLPARLLPLGLVIFSDELRREAAETLARFAAAGIEIKVISGDNPHTVAALARQAGLGPDLRTISGQKLAEMDGEQFAASAEWATVFGRITPSQKAALVAALKRRGHYVAMTGDGINDVMALKQAHLGIAMESGSQATRAVADLVLLEDSFGALPAAFEEGQRIRNGMQDVLKLFLTRLLVVTLLVGAVGFVGGFPFTPKQVSLVGLLTVGIPTVVLAARAGTGMASTRSRLLSIFHFVLPAGLSLAMTSLTAYLAVLYAESRTLMAGTPGLVHAAALQAAVPAAQSALAFSLVLCSLLAVPFVVPPVAGWRPAARPAAAQSPADADWRPSAVALALLAVYAAVISIAPLRAFFELAPLSSLAYTLITGQSVLWAVLMRWAWRSQVLERFLYGEIPI